MSDDHEETVRKIIEQVGDAAWCVQETLRLANVLADEGTHLSFVLIGCQIVDNKLAATLLAANVPHDNIREAILMSADCIVEGGDEKVPTHATKHH